MYHIVHDSFDWDEEKNQKNILKHGVSFQEAQLAFQDPHRILIEDDEHSQYEKRFFCIGKINGNIITVRYTPRDNKIRILGAGFWRKGKKRYEQEQRK